MRRILSRLRGAYQRHRIVVLGIASWLVVAAMILIFAIFTGTGPETGG